MLINLDMLSILQEVITTLSGAYLVTTQKQSCFAVQRPQAGSRGAPAQPGGSTPLVLSMNLDVLPYANAYSSALSAGNQQLGLFDGCLLVRLLGCLHGHLCMRP